jgi:hypothetical protein
MDTLTGRKCNVNITYQLCQQKYNSKYYNNNQFDLPLNKQTVFLNRSLDIEIGWLPVTLHIHDLLDRENIR